MGDKYMWRVKVSLVQRKFWGQGKILEDNIKSDVRVGRWPLRSWLRNKGNGEFWCNRYWNIQSCRSGMYIFIIQETCEGTNLLSISTYFISCNDTLNSSIRIWHPEDGASWYIIIIKDNEIHYFSDLFDKVLCMFRTGPLSIIRSISTLYTRISYLSC
jgi:hypothetical protein